jgi:protein-S-isoprenylcysteine O-methyltransferase Ste14
VVIPLTGVFFDQPRFELDYFWWKWAGMAAILLGLVILFWAKKAMGNVMAKVVDGPKELVASGPYQYLRHPIYLSLIFIFVGWWWIWAAVYTFYFGMFILTMIWLHAYFEEKYILEKLFGDKFRQYKENTGMFWVK